MSKQFSSQPSYPTPEDAARGSIPERFARSVCVSVSLDGRQAVVLLGTNEEPGQGLPRSPTLTTGSHF